MIKRQQKKETRNNRVNLQREKCSLTTIDRSLIIIVGVVNREVSNEREREAQRAADAHKAMGLVFCTHRKREGERDGC
jgi:hypothetical protein